VRRKLKNFVVSTDAAFDVKITSLFRISKVCARKYPEGSRKFTT